MGATLIRARAWPGARLYCSRNHCGLAGPALVRLRNDTSGLAWKIPGRVGDSPILGAGLYVDNEVGAAGSTGRGEANIYSLASFLVVEFLRQGMNPSDAGMAALQRIRSQTIEPRLLNEDGNPAFNVTFYVLTKHGEHAGVAMYATDESKYAVCDEHGPRHEAIEPLLPS